MWKKIKKIYPSNSIPALLDYWNCFALLGSKWLDFCFFLFVFFVLKMIPTVYSVCPLYHYIWPLTCCRCAPDSDLELMSSTPHPFIFRKARLLCLSHTPLSSRGVGPDLKVHKLDQISEGTCRREFNQESLVKMCVPKLFYSERVLIDKNSDKWCCREK